MVATDAVTETTPPRSDKTIYLGEVTWDGIALEIWKDPVANAIFGIDASFLESGDVHTRSLYNPDRWLNLSDPDEAGRHTPKQVDGYDFIPDWDT